MARLTIVIGLPGSGKTTYCRNLSAGGRVFDDFLDRGKFCTENGIEGILRELIAGRECIANETSLHTHERRDALAQFVLLQVPETNIEWRCFENAPDTCKANVRADGRTDTDERLRFIDYYSPNYTCAAGCDGMPVPRAG